MSSHPKKIQIKEGRSPSEFTEEELLECILYYSCKQSRERESIKMEIYNHARSVRDLLTLPESTLKALDIPGIERCMEYITMLREYAIRSSFPQQRLQFCEKNMQAFARMSLMKIGHCRTEVILGILFTREKRFLCIERMGLGSVNVTVFDLQTVIETIERYQASYVILVHNHPSGSCFPSPEDEESTTLIAQGCQECGYGVLDHYIVTERAVYSMYTESYLI